MNPPLVSICIPTYNRPEYLRRAVASCLAQTYRHWEIIITDNSTNNDSANLAAAWTDPRIRYFKNDGNIGANASWNRAVTLAQGKYVQVLADDDLIKPKSLELMVAAFEKNPTVGVVMAPMELIDADDRRIFPKFYIFRTMQYRYRYQVGDGLIERKRVLRDFLTRDYPCTVPSGIMYRTEAFRAMRPEKPFDAAAAFAGDLLMCMEIATQWDFFYIDEVLSAWRYMPVIETPSADSTASLHQTGLNIRVFYNVTRQILAMKPVREMFGDEREKTVRDSVFFCSCRALLNVVAGLRSRSLRLIWETLKTILQEDPYVVNFLRLPLWAFGQVWISIFPPKLPAARE